MRLLIEKATVLFFFKKEENGQSWGSLFAQIKGCGGRVDVLLFCR